MCQRDNSTHHSRRNRKNYLLLLLRFQTLAQLLYEMFFEKNPNNSHGVLCYIVTELTCSPVAIPT